MHTSHIKTRELIKLKHLKQEYEYMIKHPEHKVKLRRKARQAKVKEQLNLFG